MRLRTHPRAERLFRRLPRFTALSALELLLLALIAVQAARLVWTLVTPVDPVGEWRPASALALPAGDSALADFDPFFRLSAAGAPAVVTGLSLKLHGVREDRATGRGSAIIALPNGTQRSFAVGEEIMPGVTLAQVGFDSVTINRNGAPEQIFLDQSEPAQNAATAAPATAPAAPAAAPVTVAPPPRGPQPAQPVQTAPAPPDPNVQALRAAGVAEGDTIVSVNGRAVRSPEQALARLRGSRGPVTVIVNRGGRAVPIQVRPNP